MAQYQIPRQPTTRIELLPGVGLIEVIAAILASAVGYVVAWVLAHFEIGDYAFFLVTGFGLVGYFVVMGGQSSLLTLLLRQRHFQTTPQRVLYQLGTGERQVSTRASAGGDRKGKKGKSVSTLPKSVQTWLPVRTVEGNVIHRNDGSVVAVVRVEPVNLGLRSSSEQGRLLGLLHEAVNALQRPAQILSLPRPLDLDNYVKALEAKLLEVDPSRQRLLRLYTHHVSSMLVGGEVKERRFYILLPQPAGRDVEREVLQRAHDLTARLRQADLVATVLDDRELFDLLYVWGHPNQAAFERPPGGPPAAATLMEG